MMMGKNSYFLFSITSPQSPVHQHYISHMIFRSLMEMIFY